MFTFAILKHIKMKILQKFVSYISFKRQEGNEKNNVNLKMMHGINKISILMFLIGMIFLVFKIVSK
jgi:hypothetical protein